MSNKNNYRAPRLKYIYNRYGKASSTQPAVIELRITEGKKQKFMSTGIRLLPKQWVGGHVTNHPDMLIINKQLDKLKYDVQQILYEMMEEAHVDIFAIPERLRKLRRGKLSFLDFCRERSEIRKYGRADDSKERYDRFLRKFTDWGGIKEFDDLTDKSVLDYDRYLTKKGMKPYSKWQNYHRFLNSFINDAIAEGYLQRNPYKWVNIVKDKSTGGINKYLTPEEFDALKNCELSTDSLRRVRDLFVFQTYTCLAYADLSTFDVRKIQELTMKVYQGKRHKTGEPFTIPLVSPALKILEKYDNKLPIISLAKYNEYLKVVAQAAGIDKPVSSHWARHTGATILLNEAGMDLKIVAKILGHSTSKITEQVYAKLLDDTVVDAMEDFDKLLKKDKNG